MKCSHLAEWSADHSQYTENPMEPTKEIIVSCDFFPHPELLQPILGFSHLLNPSLTPECTHVSV